MTRKAQTATGENPKRGESCGIKIRVDGMSRKNSQQREKFPGNQKKNWKGTNVPGKNLESLEKPRKSKGKNPESGKRRILKIRVLWDVK